MVILLVRRLRSTPTPSKSALSFFWVILPSDVLQEHPQPIMNIEKADQVPFADPRHSTLSLPDT